MQDLIDKATQQAIKDIKEYIELGWSEQKAINQVRKSSTLGYGSWQKVLEVVEPQYRSYQAFRSSEL